MNDKVIGTTLDGKQIIFFCTACNEVMVDAEDPEYHIKCSKCGIRGKIYVDVEGESE